MRDRIKNIALVLLLATYFIASNGMVFEYASQWYSTGGRVAIALHAGSSKDLPVVTLIERTYLPQSFPVIIPSVALLAHTISYSVEQPKFRTWVEKSLPSFTTVLTANLSDRAPPTA